MVVKKWGFTPVMNRIYSHFINLLQLKSTSIIHKLNCQYCAHPSFVRQSHKNWHRDTFCLIISFKEFFQKRERDYPQSLSLHSVSRGLNPWPPQHGEIEGMTVRLRMPCKLKWNNNTLVPFTFTNIFPFCPSSYFVLWRPNRQTRTCQFH